jgi:nitrate reductase delta subunit
MIMNEQQRALLSIAARLFCYPSDSFHEELAEIRAFAEERFETGPIRTAVMKLADASMAVPLREMREQYVAAFDLKERTGLYLTAHELGDSRKRGEELVRLRALIRSHGFEPIPGELPDYMPLLYELVSIAPESDQISRLIDRLAFATERVRSHLAAGHSYKPLLEMLMELVFETPTEEAIQEMESRRERPDLDPLPYPLMYG